MISKILYHMNLGRNLTPLASEHLGLRELLSSLGRNNLLILDRGYVGKALLRDLIASGN